MSSVARHASTLSPKNGALDIRDEYRLLLLCARTRVDPQQSEQMRALTQKQLDWEFILVKAQPHALIPLLYRNLNRYCADLVPPAVLKQLESDNKVNADRNQKNTAEMIRVLREFKAANISAVPYKGPALAVLAHGDIELRKFWDLDIVIRPRDIIPAKMLLLSLGYEWRPMEGQVTGRNEARNFRVWHEYSFIHPDTRAMIDLHWRITPSRFPFNVDLDDIWKQLQPARLLDEDIQTFPVEALLLFLCVHGCKDMWWRRIGWVCDISELITSNPDIDWSYCLELATQTGARRMFLLGLALAHELLQAPLPEQVHAWILTDNMVQPLVEHVFHRMFDEP
ncbi:MAG: nucleotidyltransferase family protein, partial [Gammaproteobacteria bacterium]|nr:nucleotidyltransferase family protein [Gammaproteobacteria bacterium]